MANENDHLWDLMEGISICMLSTRDGENIRARPMGAYVRKAEGMVYFLTDARRHKDDEIARFPNVGLAFVDGQKYVSLTGIAQVTNDRAKIKELWSVPAQAWWDSADDPNIRLLKVTPHEAEYWEGPGTVIAYAKMAVAATTGGRPDMGTNRKVAMTGR